MKLLHSQRLDLTLTNSNDGRGHKWFRTDKHRRDAERYLKANRLCREPFSVPVYLIVIRVLGKRQRRWDWSSVGRGNWKEIEDALVACGWFHDDSPEWIAGGHFLQDDSDRSSGPAVIVEVYQHEDT